MPLAVTVPKRALYRGSTATGRGMMPNLVIKKEQQVSKVGMFSGEWGLGSRV